jgi:hypothetical protein
MSRPAVIGSCITRDIWRECDAPLDDVLYISRTSLPSLVSRPLADPPPVPDQPPPIEGIGRHSLRMVAADLNKTALAALVQHRPTHVLFDFIDERFDLLEQDGAIVTKSWELDCLELVGGPGLAAPRLLPRLSPEVEDLWREALVRIADLLHAPPLAEAQVVLHHAQWAAAYRGKAGGTAAFDGDRAHRDAQNAMLRRYRDLFVQAVPRTRVVQASDRNQQADEGHVWGLSPFHYVTDYYPDVWRQLQGLGV